MKFLAEVVNFGGGVVDSKAFENDSWTGAKRTASAFRDEVEMHSTPQRHGERFVIWLTRTDVGWKPQGPDFYKHGDNRWTDH